MGEVIKFNPGKKGNGGSGEGGDEKLNPLEFRLQELARLGYLSDAELERMRKEGLIRTTTTDDGRAGIIVQSRDLFRQKFKINDSVKVPRGRNEELVEGEEWIITAFGDEVVHTVDYQGYEVRVAVYVFEPETQKSKVVSLIELERFNS